MAAQRSQSWTVSGDADTIAQAVEDFARRQNMKAQRSGDGWELQRGSQTQMRAMGARLASEDKLPIKGSITTNANGGDGTARVEVSFESDGVGMILGAGPMSGGVERRFEGMFADLIEDLGRSLPGAST